MNHPPKYPRTFHWPWSQQVHADDSTHDNPELFVGREVIITEKLDGGNTALNSGEVYARSTGQAATQGWFAHVKKYHAWKTKSLPNTTTFYGEDLAALHSVAYQIPMDETYKVFQIRENNVFVPWDQVVIDSKALNLDVVPVLFRGQFGSIGEITKWFETEISKPSAFGPQREGFVMSTPYGFMADEFSDNVCKYVRKNHVQTDEHWTNNWTWNQLGSPLY
jgi:hypothetical protein